MSVLVGPGTKEIEVTAFFGEYKAEGEVVAEPGGGPGEEVGRGKETLWKRTPREVTKTIFIARTKTKGSPIRLDDTGLHLVTSVRPVPKGTRGVPPGTRSLSIFLVNHRDVGPDVRKDEAYVFQAGLRLHCTDGFIPRPNQRGRGSEDFDEQIAELQYRDAFEYAVGHGVATVATQDPDGHCRKLETAWMPSAEVEKVVPGSVKGVPLGMDALADLPQAQLQEELARLPDAYEVWIAQQKATELDDPEQKKALGQLVTEMSQACRRIRGGIAALGTADVLEAFRIANRAMAEAGRRRAGFSSPEPITPSWRPFQLAFVLMNLRGLEDGKHAERGIVDLLFFPTGGGKTEAYLGLAAITLVLRRLRNPGLTSAGVSVLMRYTLRLLTLDQLGRAATLICALELIRKKNPALGSWPFEIGLWVGDAATPNRMGKKGDNNPRSARARTLDFNRDSGKPSPVPIETCPWCDEKLKSRAFRLSPSEDHPQNLEIRCSRRGCDFAGETALPIVAVDEPIYRRIPCFLIATVDKFAQLPWVGLTGMLFGKADRFDKAGFYGPCDPGVGAKLDGPLLPPDLVIQDELHLISGPLGTMVGLYETAIDALSTRLDGDVKIRPKIVASTATVRRADAQISALFGRSSMAVFPPPGPDRKDSFFAQTVPSSKKHARRYLGVAAQGRSLKVVLLRTYLALLAAAERAYASEPANQFNPADPYMTLVGYFSSLRELGGSRRIVEDEVTSRLQGYDRRLRAGQSPTAGPFGRRAIGLCVELTSRESTSKVAEAKQRLALPASARDRVDVALATNMISVGLDITRLGLMVVLGQPKTTAEYIQATSRVGRDDTRPGLVVTLLNVHRPRDRSHYERFEAYHASFYRDVEATSVTPFSPRAIDRGLAAVTVALARLGHNELTPAQAAASILTVRPKLAGLGAVLAARGEAHAKLAPGDRDDLRASLEGRVVDLLDSWKSIASENDKVGVGLQYQQEAGKTPPPLLIDPMDPDLAKRGDNGRKFKAQRSLRDVEPSVNLWVRRPDGAGVEHEEES